MINQEEIEQVTKMFQWANKLKCMTTFNLFMVNQENGKPAFGIRSIEDHPTNSSQHMHVVGGGPTILETMKDYIERRERSYEKLCSK